MISRPPTKIAAIALVALVVLIGLVSLDTLSPLSNEENAEMGKLIEKNEAPSLDVPASHVPENKSRIDPAEIQITASSQTANRSTGRSTLIPATTRFSQLTGQAVAPLAIGPNASDPWGDLAGARKGEKVTIALKNGKHLSGLVQIAADPVAVEAGSHWGVGLALDQIQGATLFVERQGRHSYFGNIFLPGSSVAYDIVDYSIERKKVSDLLCHIDGAKYLEGLYPLPDQDLIRAAGLMPDEADEISSDENLVVEELIPVYNSRPSAQAVAYLDFDGQTVTGTSWNNRVNGDPIVAAPSGVSDSNIQNVWKRVSEDFRPFDINVTTEESVYLSAPETRRIRVIVTPTKDWYGSAGGVAYLRSFRRTGDTPCWVFITSNAKNIAEAASHEIGHTLGLSHDGLNDGSTTYYRGHGTGDTGWAPIMGVGYYENLVQWSKGEYSNANQTQDDIAIIKNDNGFGYRADDVGNNANTASELPINSSRNIASNTTGVIERSTDVDVYQFMSGPGQLSLTIDPFGPGDNLDVLAVLKNSSGATVTSINPSGALHATITRTVTQDTYTLEISGVGKGNPLDTGYTDYGSLGEYKITGTVPELVNIPDSPVNLSPPNNSTQSTESPLTLTWSTGINTQEVDVYFGTDHTPDASEFQVTLPVATKTWTFPGITTEGTNYYWRINARSDEGYETEGPVWRVQSVLPAPTDISASDREFDDGVEISWTPVAGASTYSLYRSTTASSTNSRLIESNITGTTSHDESAFPGVVYHYFVKAKGTALSLFSTSDSGVRAFPIPDRVSSFSASNNEFVSEIKLTWSSVEWDTEYVIRRSESTNRSTAEIVQIVSGDDPNTWTDRVTPGILYQYWISARNESGEGTETTTSGRAKIPGYARSNSPGPPRENENRTNVITNTDTIGKFVGLLRDTDNGEIVGEISPMAVRFKKEVGYYTAKIFWNGRKLSLKGSFDNTGASQNEITIKKTGEVITTSLQLTRGETFSGYQVTGEISTDTSSAEIDLRQLVYHKKNRPSPQQGIYTVVLPAWWQWDDDIPQGDGYASMKVDAAGKVTLVGQLGDGSRLSERTYLFLEHETPVFVPLYKNQGHIAGWLTSRVTPNISDWDGEFTWKCPANPKAKIFPAGFDVSVDAIAARYYPPVKAPALPNIGVPENNALLILEGDFANNPSPITISWNDRNALYQPGFRTLSAKVNSKDGLVRGSLNYKHIGLKLKFGGVVLQNQGYVFGTWYDKTAVGRVVIEAK